MCALKIIMKSLELLEYLDINTRLGISTSDQLYHKIYNSNLDTYTMIEYQAGNKTSKGQYSSTQIYEIFLSLTIESVSLITDYRGLEEKYVVLYDNKSSLIL